MTSARRRLCIAYALIALLALVGTWTQNVAYFRADEGAVAGFAAPRATSAPRSSPSRWTNRRRADLRATKMLGDIERRIGTPPQHEPFTTADLKMRGGWSRSQRT